MFTASQLGRCVPRLAVVFWIVCETNVYAVPCDLTQVQHCTWAGDDYGFLTVGENGSTISFQTLPDGSPSYGGAAITPAFNYVLQGAFFSPALPSLFITGNELGYGLTAHSSNIISHNSITAQLTNPERGVGVYVAGNKTLFAYDAQGTLITSVSHNSFGTVYFLGIKSNVAIARAVIDNGTNSITIGNFRMAHIPVPEPSTAALLLFAVPIFFRRGGRRGSIYPARLEMRGRMGATIRSSIRIAFFASAIGGLPASQAHAVPCDLTQVPYCTWAWSNNGFFDVGFGLTVHNSSPIAHNSIIAQLTNPDRGVGVWVIGHTTLFAYDTQGSLITSVWYDDPNGIRYFLGIKSSVPIARVVVDRGQNAASLDDFTMIHVSVPDPASTALLLIAAPILFRRRSRRGRIGVARNV